MIPFNATVDEIEEMIRLAESDAGMLDLLLKAKEYYLMKSDAETIIQRAELRKQRELDRLEQKIDDLEKKTTPTKAQRQWEIMNTRYGLK